MIFTAASRRMSKDKHRAKDSRDSDLLQSDLQDMHINGPLVMWASVSTADEETVSELPKHLVEELRMTVKGTEGQFVLETVSF